MVIKKGASEGKVKLSKNIRMKLTVNQITRVLIEMPGNHDKNLKMIILGRNIRIF